MALTREQYIAALAAGTITYQEVRDQLGAINPNYNPNVNYQATYNDNQIQASGNTAQIGARFDAMWANANVGAPIGDVTLFQIENQINGGAGGGGGGGGRAGQGGGPVDEFALDDARAYLNGVLEQYGLASLGDWAFGLLQAGRSADYIIMELRNRQEFKDRFPAIEARRQAGLSPISPAEYVAYEQQARQILRQFGLPEGFYDQNSDFTQFLTNDVSVAELYERAQQGYQRVAYAPIEVRAAFMDFFGTQGDAALAAVFLDPERAVPLLKEMATEAEIGGAARQQQIMTDLQTARRLREFGVTQDAAREGFRRVRQLDPLFSELVGEGEDFTAEGIGTSTAFGLDATDVRRMERRRASRVADFSGAGGAALGQRGVAGVGVDAPTI